MTEQQQHNYYAKREEKMEYIKFPTKIREGRNREENIKIHQEQLQWLENSHKIVTVNPGI